MAQEKFTYIINNKTYIQRPLVLGQVNQLMALLRNVVLPDTGNMKLLIASLANKLPMALAIVLHEEKPPLPAPHDERYIYLRDRDLNALSDELEFNIDPLTPLRVIEDFFDCNPIASLLEKFGGLGEKLNKKIRTMKDTGSKTSPPSSPEATSPGETPSSGASLSPSAART